MPLEITRTASASVRCDTCSYSAKVSAHGVRAVTRLLRESGWRFKVKRATCKECSKKQAVA